MTMDVAHFKVSVTGLILKSLNTNVTLGMPAHIYTKQTNMHQQPAPQQQIGEPQFIGLEPAEIAHMRLDLFFGS